jgi:hypothetical protein
MQFVNVRLKLLITSLLLCIALASVIFAAASTVRAYQHFTQNHQQIATGDTSTVSSWMTLPYIAHVYHIPESCLFQSLHIPAPISKKYATLRFIADYVHRPLDAVMHDVRITIEQYRQHHLICPSSTPAVQLIHSSHYFLVVDGRNYT